MEDQLLSQFQITANGDDSTTPEKDGFAEGESIIWKFEDDNGNQYNLTPTDVAPSSTGPANIFSTNGISIVTGISFEAISCGGGDDPSCEYSGCTDISYLEYDPQATIDNGSCETLILVGCSDVDACNFEPLANIEDNTTCIYKVFGYDCDGNLWEDLYGSCADSGGDDGIGQAEVDAAYAAGAAESAQACAAELADSINAMQASYDALNTYWQDLYNSVTPDDGVSQADVDAAVAAAQAIAADEISALEAQIDAILLSNGDDGITQSDVDAAVAAAEAAAASQIAELESQVLGSYVSGYSDGAASVTPEDGIGQADVDAAFDTGVASVDITVDNQDAYDAGVASVDITVDNQDAYDAGAASVDVSSNDQDVYDSGYDNGYDAGVNSVDITSDNSSIADLSYLNGYNDGAGSVTPEDGIGQADLDALQLLLDEALANSGGSCEPIYIDLLEGWNIMGYTLPNPQDVAATLSSIVSDVQIVKNNAAAVYWPEYSFNGIGDFIPGQGYQIRMINAFNSYTFPDVGNQRIELSPTVPEWVHDIPILNHPNDIRSLVRVVNMLGQQVDPNTQFKGEILLYLYNDGTTEKRMVE